MKFGARCYCVFALFACLCLTSSRVYSDEPVLDKDYSILTRGSEEDRTALKKLNDLLKKAYEGREVVRNWSKEYAAQEQKTRKEIVGLIAKFNESERKQLAQDLKKGKLSEAFYDRLDAQKVLNSFQRLEVERGFLAKINTLDEQLSSKIIEAESKREIIAKRIVTDVQDVGFREKEEIIDELSKIIDDANRKIDAWKENGNQKEKGNLIDQIVNDSKVKGKKERKQKGGSKTEESSVNDSIQGWKNASSRSAEQQVSEFEDEKTEEQTEAEEEISEEQAEVEEEISEEQAEVEEEISEEQAEAAEENSEEQVEVEEENSKEQDEFEEENSEESGVDQEKGTPEESEAYESVPLQVLDEVCFLEQKIDDDASLEESKAAPKADEKLKKIEKRQETQEESFVKPNVTEGVWTKVENVNDLASSVSVQPSKVVTSADLRSASKSSISQTQESSNQRRIIFVRNVEFAFRLCPGSDQGVGEEFWIQETETTQEQWFVVGAKTTRACYFKGAKLPVENVDWNACVGFVKKLNESNAAPEGWMFTIPTAAQWERAWKLGKSGDDLASLVEYAWFGENSDKKTHEVATKKSDALGLYDMSGNVWEWTRSTDATGKALVVRGSSWKNLPENGALVDSFNCAAQTCGNNLGLRLVLVRKPLVAAPNTRKILR